MPGLSFEIVRPKEIHLVGVDLDGNDVSFEADELLARLFQHELDHLDGVLLLEHLDDGQRKAALKELRRRTVQTSRLRPSTGPACSGPGRPVPALPVFPRRLAFLGTPAVSAARCERWSTLVSTCRSWCTRADKRRSRGGGDDPSPVKAAALELGLPVTSKVDDVSPQASISVWSSPSVS